MSFRFSQSPYASSVRHHDRGLTLVFGSDGQVSLIGFDGGIPTQPVGVPPTLTTGIRSLPNEPTSVLPIPNHEASSTGSTSFSSTTSLTSSTPDPSSTAADTDTNLPSIPTVSYPTPSPTAVSDPKDHGVGAPFYLAIVLASISFVGCVAAFIAWWIRSRARKRNLELDDPWNHRNSISDAGSLFTDNANDIEKGTQTHADTQTRPYYLPASIVRRSSSNLLAVPHTMPTLEEGVFSRAMLDANRFPSLPRADEPHPQNVGPEPNLRSNVNSSTNPSRPSLQTWLSVQESMRTLGRLRVANRVPGDITSGDEGATNIPRGQDTTAANHGAPTLAPAGGNAAPVDQSDRSIHEGESLLEPPGPATFSWGRRLDSVAALRRTRRRTPSTTVQTYKNPRYSGYLYPLPDRQPSGVEPQASITGENGRNRANTPPDPLGWTNTLKSSFWQAVDAMTGNRPSELEPRTLYAGSGSRFTPAPQRVASRHSLVSSARSATDSALTDARSSRYQETETRSELTLPENSVITQVSPQNTIYSSSRTSSTRTNESGLPLAHSRPPKVSHLNRDGHLRLPHPPKTESGSVYSTDTTAARANLRKYGYAESIPSSWSALSAMQSRESQLDLARTFFPLPRPISSPSPGPLSVTPSQVTLESASPSVRTRTTAILSESDVRSSDVSTIRFGQGARYSGEATTSSSYSMMSRGGTIQSGRSTVSVGSGMHSSSTASSMLSRKKGVATRRKRPRPPARAPSTASSVQSFESGLSMRDVVVRRALLERRKKVRAQAESLKDREEDASSSLPVPVVPTSPTTNS